MSDLFLVRPFKVRIIFQGTKVHVLYRDLKGEEVHRVIVEGDEAVVNVDNVLTTMSENITCAVKGALALEDKWMDEEGVLSDASRTL